MQGFAHLLLLSGPSGGGKSTFARQMKDGALSAEIAARLPQSVGSWPVIDVTNKMRRRIETEGEAAVANTIGNPASFVLHYDITTVYRYGLAGYEADPALRLLRLARDIQIVFVCPDAERLFSQYTGRDALRQKRKSAAARIWNGLVLRPLRQLRSRLVGQPLNAERALYSDPDWLHRCYGAWEAYMSALTSVGAARDVLRIAPCHADGTGGAFRIVSEPQWPMTTRTAAAGDKDHD